MERKDNYWLGEETWQFPPMASEYRTHDAQQEKHRITVEYGRDYGTEYWDRYRRMLHDYARSVDLTVMALNQRIKQKARPILSDNLPDKQPMFTEVTASGSINGITTTGARIGGTVTLSQPTQWNIKESEQSMNLRTQYAHVITGFVGQVVDINTEEIIWQSAPVTVDDLTEKQRERATEPREQRELLAKLARKKADEKVAEATKALFADGPVQDPEA